MTVDTTKYRTGYSVGVGGVVVYRNKVLLVRSALGDTANEWMIPGGFVEPGETIDVAVQREVREETGIHAKVQGLIAARSRVSHSENSAYFIFLLQTTTEETNADGVEVKEARFFTLAEAQELSGLRTLSRMIVTRVLEDNIHILAFHPHPDFSPGEYVLYL